eukprot:TRINITY_DN19442_c0_g1_i1.p1 TRINITY_DN19442_c0_g1~~TRINITY_DN19442_c0_g1_i1.p1  ORF type:complete len:464 (-),score=58.17 TRINITY_DN19442_c0_g1_i1:160-1551(-)
MLPSAGALGGLPGSRVSGDGGRRTRNADSVRKDPGATPAHLGRLAVTRGGAAAVRPRCETLASQSVFTRKLSVLLPSLRGQDEKHRLEQELSCLQVQHANYELKGVPLASLGDQGFADSARAWRLACLSRGRGLHADTVLAVRPCGDLILSMNGPTYQCLGVEEPLAGSVQLRKLGRLLMPADRRHVRIALGVSKARAKRAASVSADCEPASRWRAIADPRDTCDFDAYCETEEEVSDDSSGAGGKQGGLGCLLAKAASVRRVPLAATKRRLSLPDVPSSWVQAGACLNVGEWFGQLVRGMPCDASIYGEACEDLLDWVGALHLGLGNVDMAGSAGVRGRSGGSSRKSAELPGDDVEAFLWTLGEGLMGPGQVLHALKTSFDIVSGASSAPWCLVSWWGDEDAPVSHHGGAHGFDVNGSHNVHLLIVRTDKQGCSGVPPACGEEVTCLLIESANALHSFAPSI